MEGLLQQVLAAPLPQSPETLTLHARALECFGRLLAADPSAVPAVIQRVRLPPSPESRHTTPLKAGTG